MQNKAETKKNQSKKKDTRVQLKAQDLYVLRPKIMFYQTAKKVLCNQMVIPNSSLQNICNLNNVFVNVSKILQ